MNKKAAKIIGAIGIGILYMVAAIVVSNFLMLMLIALKEIWAEFHQSYFGG